MTIEPILERAKSFKSEIIEVNRPNIYFKNGFGYDDTYKYSSLRRLSRSCFSINIDESQHTVKFKFYAWPSDNPGSLPDSSVYMNLMSLLDSYLGHPGELATVSMVYKDKTLNLKGNIDRTVPIVNTESLGHDETLTYLLLTLTDIVVETILNPVQVIVEPKISLFTKIKNWFKNLFTKPKPVIVIDENDLTLELLDKNLAKDTAYLAAYHNLDSLTKMEAEEQEAKLLDQDMRSIYSEGLAKTIKV